MEKKKLLTNTLFVAVAAMFCCALWGSATPFIKIGYELILPERNIASTILFAGTRFFIAGIVTVLIYSIARRKFLFPKHENLGAVATVASFQTIIQYLFFYIGLANTTGVKGTVISGSNSFFFNPLCNSHFPSGKADCQKNFCLCNRVCRNSSD